MKNEAAFLDFLNARISRRTGKPMKPRAASDVLSRCVRVERILGVDLYTELTGENGQIETVATKIRAHAESLGFVGKKRYYYNDFVSAVRIYYAFLTGERPSDRQWSLVPKRRRKSRKK
jgi:hypothetical protein